MNARTRQASAVTSDMLVGTTAIDPLNADIGAQDKSITLDGDTSLEALRDSLNATVSHDINDPHLKQFAESLAFMEEKVLVCVHQSTDPAAENIVEVWNNGTPQRFPRGTWVICKRKFVEVLARAKQDAYTTPEITDANGDRTTRIDKRRGLRYPFEMRDQNPKGQQWLASIIAQA